MTTATRMTTTNIPTFVLVALTSLLPVSARHLHPTCMTATHHCRFCPSHLVQQQQQLLQPHHEQNQRQNESTSIPTTHHGRNQSKTMQGTCTCPVTAHNNVFMHVYMQMEMEMRYLCAYTYLIVLVPPPPHPLWL